MRVYLILILHMLLSFFSVCFARTFEVDKIIAVVNNQVILNKDLNQMLFYLKQEKNNFKTPFKINFLKDKMLQKLIIDHLILEEANKLNIVVTDYQVNAILQNIAFKNHITVEELKNNIILNNTNSFFSYQDYLTNIKNSLKIKIVQDYILKNRVHVSEKKIYFLLKKIINKTNELKKIDLKCIILPFKNNIDKKIIFNQKILMNNLFNKIKNSNFDYFYNYFKKNKDIFLIENIPLDFLKNLRKLFFDKLYIFKKNQILGPILGKKGFYILKVNDIKNNHIEKIETEFHIQHILIRPSIILKEIEAKKNIFKIYHAMKLKRYSFEYAVKNFSHDMYSIHKKGDLGWLSKRLLNYSFKNILINLNINEISKPIKSSIGWHIIKLLGKRKVDQTWKLEKEKIYQILLKDEIKKVKKSWIQELKDTSYIDIF
ncbi:Chaperone SurA [Buchnera aphidicola (Protaphis terricola)]